MNEDIKILREAAQALLNMRDSFPQQHERAQIIDDFQMACQPERILRVLEGPSAHLIWSCRCDTSAT